MRNDLTISIVTIANNSPLYKDPAPLELLVIGQI